MMICLITAAAAFALPGISVADTVADVFPAEPFNSMQIEYTVTGVSVGEPKDTSGYTTAREYKGSTTSHNIHVTGTFFFLGSASKGGTTYDCEVALYTLPFWSSDPGELLGERLHLTGQTGSYVPFDVWLNVPQDQEEVQVKILMEGNFANWQDRNLEVVFKLDNADYGRGSYTGGSSDGGYSTGGSYDDDDDYEELGMSALPLIGAGLLVCLLVAIRKKGRK
ncbi:MAG: hypothetical protein A4E28_02009 [Methanocella sp. PtaU1.Bin125]|nr:MAG: hypothetical protein A4E28_02009 [Methanocella sp. PtaU1.Bin125]